MGKKQNQDVKVEWRYFTKETLREAIGIGEREDFNRQFRPEILDALEGDVHPAHLAMIHEHKDGVRCEPHARLWIEPRLKSGEDCGDVIDVPLEFWAKMPVLAVCMKRPSRPVVCQQEGAK